MRVYVAGPLNAMAVDYLKNVHSMMEAAEVIRCKGHSVYIPALDLLMGIMFGNYEYADYFDNSQHWLEVSDVVFLCPGYEQSSGCKREIALAAELGIRIETNLDSLSGDKRSNA